MSISVRHLAAVLGLVVAALAVLPVTASYAAGPTDVYVATAANGGSDTNDCSQASPCASVAAALAAVADGGTVHVGAGTFDGPVVPDAKSVDVVGVSTATTTLTNSAISGGVFAVVEVGSGSTSLSHLTAQGPFVSVAVFGTGILSADHVVLETSLCPLVVFAGEADVTDSTIQGAGTSDCSDDPGSRPPLAGDVAMSGGNVSLVRTSLLAPSQGAPAVVVKGGSLTVDQSVFDDSANDLDTNESDGVEVVAGTADITRSTFRGFGSSAVHTLGGTASVSDSTFLDNVVGVTGDSGTATVVRSTFEQEFASLQGTVSVGGSVLGSMLGTPSIGIMECANATVTDLGYNLSSDSTCGFTGTSRDGVTDLGLDTSLADHGGGVPTVATRWSSPAVDAIPADATYGDSSTPLCAGTDVRGVPRPQAGACDAGSMELIATTTSLQAPATAKPHAHKTLHATVEVPDVGVDSIEAAAGTVSFRSGSTVLCQEVALTGTGAQCTTSALTAGLRHVRATFVPGGGSTLHGSVSASRTVAVGTEPAFTSRTKATFVVGKTRTFKITASGRPAAAISRVSGKLPAGLHLHAGDGSATVTGKAKASAVGTHRITLKAANLRGTAQQMLRIVVRRP